MIRIVQLTDTHIRRHGKLAYRRADTADALRRAVRHINRLADSVGRIDAVFATGDLTDMGTADEFAMFRELTTPLNMPMYVLPGNHDRREPMREAFADASYLPATGTLDYAVDLGGLRVLALDSTVPRQPHGELRPEQLAWLDSELRRLDNRPAVVFLHHPPFDTGIHHMDVQRLMNADEFLAVAAAHRNLLLIGCGHVHRTIASAHNGIPLLIAPSPSHAVELNLLPDGPPGFRMEPGAVMLHAWQADQVGGSGNVVSQQSFIGEFDGPFPFFNSDGTLID